MRSILTMYDIADDDPIVIPPKESKDRSHGTMAAGLIAGIPDNQE